MCVCVCVSVAGSHIKICILSGAVLLGSTKFWELCQGDSKWKLVALQVAEIIASCNSAFSTVS